MSLLISASQEARITGVTTSVQPELLLKQLFLASNFIEGIFFPQKKNEFLRSWQSHAAVITIFLNQPSP
jgi:hypothetical protein